MYQLLASTNTNAGGAGIAVLLVLLFLATVLPGCCPSTSATRSGQNRNRVTAGWLLPLLLGWLGVVIVACMGTDHPYPAQVNVYNAPYPPQQGHPLPPPAPQR